MSNIAFLFPGQGAQYVGMARALYESFPAARARFEEANDLLGYDLAQVCFAGPESELNTTARSQPAIFTCSMVALDHLRVEHPDAVAACAWAAGLSLGEYSALVFSGVMDFATALRVVALRGEAMQAAADLVPSGMVSILGLELDIVEELCRAARQENEVLGVANHLCPGNIVVSGHRAACERMALSAVERGAMKTIPLAVAGAFHTSLMQPAVEQLQSALQEAKLSSPRVPVISNVDAQAHADPEEIRQLLIRQVCAPVLWEDSVRSLLASGCDLFYEVGPGRVLRGLLKRIDRKAATIGTLDP